MDSIDGTLFGQSRDGIGENADLRHSHRTGHRASGGERPKARAVVLVAASASAKLRRGPPGYTRQITKDVRSDLRPRTLPTMAISAPLD